MITIAIFISVFCVMAISAFTLFTIFFDQAVLVRKGTFYRKPTVKKVVALTFDDGPSPVWTPKILKVLKDNNIKATFFMLGEHVKKYPQVAREVARAGHEIGNHGYNHKVMIYYKDNELKDQIKGTEAIIEEVAGVKTKYFRPPKAWLNSKEKQKARKMGYEVVLWSLNSKDWVNFDKNSIVRYLAKRVEPGDIILFHDSGAVFSCEGGNRSNTVEAIGLLAEKLKAKGYSFLTLSELLEGN